MSTPNSSNKEIDILFSSEVGDDESSIDLWSIATTLGEEKKFIAILTGAIVVITAIVSLIMTPTYSAKATFIVPNPTAGASAAQAMANLGGLIGGGAASLLGGGKSPDEMYMEFLKSQTISNMLIEKFDLQKRYETKSLAKTQAALKSRTLITSNKKAGLITVQADDSDPQFSADLANAYIAALKEMLRNFAAGEARQRQQYYEDQLIRAKTELLGTTDYREMKVRESVLSVIMNQYEVATLDSARESVIQVAEPAIAPEQRAKPKRTIMVLIAAFAGLFLSILIALARRKYLQMQQDPQDRNHWAGLKAAWRWKK
jgi:tyrosine-protein kinase Etk/Wzc